MLTISPSGLPRSLSRSNNGQFRTSSTPSRLSSRTRACPHPRRIPGTVSCTAALRRSTSYFGGTSTNTGSTAIKIVDISIDTKGSDNPWIENRHARWHCMLHLTKRIVFRSGEACVGMAKQVISVLIPPGSDMVRLPSTYMRGTGMNWKRYTAKRCASSLVSLSTPTVQIRRTTPYLRSCGGRLQAPLSPCPHAAGVSPVVLPRIRRYAPTVAGRRPGLGRHSHN